MAGFGGAVKLTGESEYKRALQSITQSLREVSSQMRLTAASYSHNDNSMKALTARQNDLTAKLGLLKDKLSMLKGKYAEMDAQYQRSTSKHIELIKKYEDEKAKLEHIGKTLGTTSSEYKAQEKVVADLERQVKQSADAENTSAKAMSEMGVKIRNTEADITKTERSLGTLNSEMEKNSRKAREAQSAYGTLHSTISNQESKLQSLKREYVNVVLEQGKNSKSARELASQISSLSGHLQENKTKMSDAEKAADKLDKSLDDVGNSAKNSSSGFTVLKGVIANLVTSGIQRLTGAITGELQTAISRVDIINSYKNTMQNLGYATEDVSRTTEELKTGIEGLPTTLPSIMSMQKQYAALSGNLDEATQLTLALNNATLAGGQGQEIANSAMEQWYQIIAKGKPDLQSWRIILQAMPAQLNQVAESVLGTGKKSQDLFEAWKAGTVTTDQVKQALIKLNKDGGGSLSSFEKQAQDSTGGIATSFTNIKTAIANALANIIESIGQANIAGFFNSLKPVIKQTGDVLADFVKKINWQAFGQMVASGLELALQGFKWIINNSGLVIAALKLMIAGFVITHINAWIKSVHEAITGIIGLVSKIGAFITSIYAKVAAEHMDTAALKLNAASQLANNTASTAGTLVTKTLTAAHLAFNAVLRANPLGVLLTVVTAAITIFSLFSNTTNEASAAQDNLSNELEEQKKAIEESKKAWDDMIATQQKSITEGLNEIDYYRNLYNELNTLVDVSGRVKAGYEERAAFITGELKNALGVEVTTVNGVVQGYNNLVNSFNQVIEKKKAMIILEGQEEAYKKALKEIPTLEQQAAEAKRVATEKKAELDKKEAESFRWRGTLLEFWKRKEVYDTRESYVESYKIWNESNKQLNEAYAARGIYQKNAVLFQQGCYDQMEILDANFLANQDNTQKSERQILEEKIKTAQNAYDTLLDAKKRSNSDIYDAELEKKRKSLENLKSELAAYDESVKSGNNAITSDWKTGIANQLSAITSKKYEFKDAGNGQVAMFVNGVQQGEPKAENEMAKFANELVKQLDKGNEAQKSGLNILEGVSAGISNAAAQGRLIGKAQAIAKNVLDCMNKVWVIRSPSRATKKSGQFLIQGIEVGLKSEENSALHQIKTFANKTLETLNDGISFCKMLNNGKSLAQGMGKGFTDEMTKVTRDMQNSIPTEFDTGLKMNAQNSLKGNNIIGKSDGFVINIENFNNNRSQDVQAFAKELEFYSRRSSWALG